MDTYKEWQEKSAQEQYDLAIRYENGDGIEKDLFECIHLWHDAAENRHKEAKKTP